MRRFGKIIMWLNLLNGFVSLYLGWRYKDSEFFCLAGYSALVVTFMKMAFRRIPPVQPPP